MTILAIAVGVLWVLVVVLSVLVVLLYRQFGLIYIGSRARVGLTGLAVGATAPARAQLVMAGRHFEWDWNTRNPGRGTLVVFGQPACTLCEQLTPHLNELADKWARVVDVLFVERGPLADGPTHDPDNRTQWMYAEDPNGDLSEAFDIEATPYAFVVDSTRTVLSKGIVNGPRDVEGVLSLALASQGALNGGSSEANGHGAEAAPGVAAI